MAYEMVMPYHLHMPSYFLETFTEYPYLRGKMKKDIRHHRINGRCLMSFRINYLAFDYSGMIVACVY